MSTRYILRGVRPLGGQAVDLTIADGVIAAIDPVGAADASQAEVLEYVD